MAKVQRVMPRVRPSRGGRGMQTDSLHNLLSGMGGAGDKSVFTYFGNTTIDRAQCETAYRNDWIARKVIDIPAQDATRAWRDWQAETKQITDIEDAESQFNLKRKLMLGVQKARLYGGAALIMGVDQGKPEDELDIEAVGKDDLKFVHAVSNNEITAGPLIEDLMSPFFGEPEFYERNGLRPVKLHPSRVVRLIGMEHPDPRATNGWGDPVLQIVRDAILACGTVSQSVAHLIADAKLDVIKIPELTAMIADKDYEARLKQRFGLASDAKSIFNMLLLDKEEEWERITTNFTALADIIKMYLLMASGAADIPATRLLGQSPAGLNATGDSDTRNYYDRIQTEQTTVLSPAIERLDEVLIRSALGSRPDGIFYTWTPLWQMDDKEKAEVDNKKAATFKIDVDAGVLDGAVLKEARENQLIEDGTYPGIEQTIESLGQEYEEPQPMLVGPGAVDPNNPNVPPVDPNKQAAAITSATDRIRLTDARKRVMVRVRPNKAKRTYRMDKRHHRMIADARPKTLYVRRDLLNHAEVAKHFKSQGFKTTTAGSMHVTIAYSREYVDWMKAGTAWGQDEKGNLTIPPGGVRIVEKLQEAVCLLFVSSDLTWRWCDIKERTGADWKWPDYQPHITISYTGAPADISKVLPYTGELKFGPEVFEEINTDYADLVVEDAKAAKLWGNITTAKRGRRR